MIDRASFLTGALLAMASGATPAPSPSAPPNPWDQCVDSQALPYDRPIDLTMDVLDGKNFRLRDYRGRAVILNIFATWCPPCNHEQPLLVDAAARYAAQGLAVIGINDGEADDTVRAYRKKYGIEFPIAMDRSSGFSRALELGTNRTAAELLPTSLFFTPAGYLYCEIQGGMYKDELDYRIRTFLVNAPPTVIPSPSPSPSHTASA